MPATEKIDKLLEKTLEDLPSKEYLWSPENAEQTKKPSKNIKLTVALNLAFKNYERIRPKIKSEGAKKPALINRGTYTNLGAVFE